MVFISSDDSNITRVSLAETANADTPAANQMHVYYDNTRLKSKDENDEVEIYGGTQYGVSLGATSATITNGSDQDISLVDFTDTNADGISDDSLFWDIYDMHDGAGANPERITLLGKVGSLYAISAVLELPAATLTGTLKIYESVSGAVLEQVKFAVSGTAISVPIQTIARVHSASPYIKLQLNHDYGSGVAIDSTKCRIKVTKTH